MYTPLYFCEQKIIFEGRAKISTFLCDPPSLKSVMELKQETRRNQEFIKWINRKQRGQWNPINIILPICFHLNHKENGKENSLSEAHIPKFKIQKPVESGGSYLDPELSIFVRFFKFYLMAQSLLILKIHKLSRGVYKCMDVPNVGFFWI